MTLQGIATLSRIIAEHKGLPAQGKFVTYIKLTSRAAYQEKRPLFTSLGFEEYWLTHTLGLQDIAGEHLAKGREVVVCEFPLHENDEYDEPCYNLFVVLHRLANLEEKDAAAGNSSIAGILAGVQVNLDAVKSEILKIGTHYYSVAG